MPVRFFCEKVAFKIPNAVKIKAWINQSCKNEGFQVEGINYIICNDSYLLNLNCEYLDHKTLTDIISFDYSENKKLSGDIFISIERVKENAKKFSVPFENEFHRVLVHGVLHLMGYSDKSKTQKIIMRKKENEYLSLWDK